MKPRNSTPYGSRNRYGVAAPLRRTRGRPPVACWDSGRARATVLVTDSAVLLLVGAEDSGGGLGRTAQRAGRIALAQDRALERVEELAGGIGDARHRRREVHVRYFLGERLEVGQLGEVG